MGLTKMLRINQERTVLWSWVSTVIKTLTIGSIYRRSGDTPVYPVM